MFGIFLGLIEFFQHFQTLNISRWFKNLVRNFSKSGAFNVNSSIGGAIRNASGVSMRKVIESGNDRTEVTVDTLNSEEKVKKCINLWENYRYLGTKSCDFSIEKANLPENTIFYINQAYQCFKNSKKVYYTNVFILPQIMLLAQQPKDIESYELNDNEVKILRLRHDPVSVKFLGIEYCVALVTVRNNQDEQFFNYGYHKENSKVLYSTRKLKILSSFKTAILGQHKMQYEGGAFNEQKFSKRFFYLPATVDRNEKINKYLTSVHLKPFLSALLFLEKHLTQQILILIENQLFLT